MITGFIILRINPLNIYKFFFMWFFIIMNIKKKLFVSTSIFLFAFAGNAEINNKDILMELFKGCVMEQNDGISAGAQFDYCWCITHQVSSKMDLEEAILLGLDVAGATNQKEEQQIILSNQKMKRIVGKCVVKLYE